MMKAIAILGLAAAVFATGASAADLTIPATPDKAIDMASTGWDGFYLGVNVGGGRAHRSGTSILGPAGGGGPTVGQWDYDLTGGLIGAQAGFNYTLTDNFLVGVEVSGDVANLHGNDYDVNLNPGGGDSTYNWLAMATAKLGYSTGNFLVYVDGGYAMAGLNFNGSLGCNFNETDGGFTAGVGASAKLTSNISADLSYHHVWFPDVNSTCTATFLPVTVQNTAPSMDLVKLGLNYHF
jgi:opacity protein-like surface antigen